MIKKQNITNIALYAACIFLPIQSTFAERPTMPRKELQAIANHVVTGKVIRTYSNAWDDDLGEYTAFVVEISVSGVLKGKGIAINERLFIRCKQRQAHRFEKPGGMGQVKIPVGGDTVEVYLKGVRWSGYDVIEPNGFFKIIPPNAADN